MARDLRSSNVADLEVRASADGSELIPCELNGRDVYLTAAQIAALAPGGSGLPPQWTQNDATGEVVAQTNDPTLTALELLAPAGTETPPLVITSDTELGDTDLLLVRQSVAKGGSDIFTVDDSGEVNLHVVDPNAQGLTIEDGTGPGTARLFKLSGSMEFRNEIAAFLATDIGGVPGVVAETLFTGGLRFVLTSFGRVLDFDPVVGTTRMIAHTGQTAPLLVLTADDSVTDVARVLPSGAIGTSAGEPADADINAGECFRWFDPTNGAAAVMYKGKSADGTVVAGSFPL